MDYKLARLSNFLNKNAVVGNIVHMHRQEFLWVTVVANYKNPWSYPIESVD